MTELTDKAETGKEEKMLTFEECNSLLSYEERTGLLRWKVRPAEKSKAKVGDVAGSKKKDGYITIRYQGHNYQAHVLAWLLKTDTWPDSKVDHKNTVRDDNRWANLRLASNSESQWNKGRSVNNTSGAKNVYWNESSQRWRVSISANNRRYEIGNFKHLDSAKDAARIAREILHGPFVNHADEGDIGNWIDDWV